MKPSFHCFSINARHDAAIQMQIIKAPDQMSGAFMMLPSLQDTVSEASETISDVGRMDTLACFCILESKTSLSSFLPFFLFSADPTVYERIIHTISMGKSFLVLSASSFPSSFGLDWIFVCSRLRLSFHLSY